MKTTVFASVLALLAPFATFATFAADDLVVHEWGTFTSVFGSDGAVLPGLEVDEEKLPPFVYAHDMERGFPQFKLEGAEAPLGLMFVKGMARPLKNVTVKMETPVLYFYSSAALDAKLSVGFKGGSISQWYPARSGGEVLPTVRKVKDGPVLGGIDFSETHRGAIEWKFRIEPRSDDTEFEVMKPNETATWLHPRAPKSSLLRTPSGETETYLFYRGLGNFEQPIGFRVEGQQLLANSDREIPFLLVLDSLGHAARVLFSGKPATTQTIALGTGEMTPMSQLRGEIYGDLHAALTDAGLFGDEAAAMLRTWWHSYFSQPGLRAFWVVPRDFTDEILPLEMTPKPARIERVLLGRSELLTPEFEAELAIEFAKPDGENRFQTDRYHRAYQERVKQLGAKVAGR